MLLLLPAPVSIGHAGLAQLFFCLTVSLALFTSPGWTQRAQTPVDDPMLRRVALATTVADLLPDPARRDDEAYRGGHGDSGFPAGVRPSGAAVLERRRRRRTSRIASARSSSRSAILATAGHVWYHHRARRELVRPATLLVLFVLTQVTLGAFVIWSGLQPIINTAHVVNGALVLATSLVLTLRSFRCGFALDGARAARAHGARPHSGILPGQHARHEASTELERSTALHVYEVRRAIRSGRRHAHARTTDFVALAKPRLNLLVVVSALAGYVDGGGDTHDVVAACCAMVAGTGLVAGGASAFNQIIEREPDALMHAHAPAADAGRPASASAMALLFAMRAVDRRAWPRSRSAPTCSAPWWRSSRWRATPSSTRRSSGTRRSRRSSARFRARCRR